jgi:hypothetical protein
VCILISGSAGTGAAVMNHRTPHAAATLFCIQYSPLNSAVARDRRRQQRSVV